MQYQTINKPGYSGRVTRPFSKPDNPGLGLGRAETRVFGFGIFNIR